MRLIRVTFVVSALAMLGGCAAAPANTDDAGSPGHSEAAASSPKLYRAPDLGLGIGISGGGRPHSRGYGYR